MEIQAVPNELVWTGELRLSVLVPSEWDEAEQAALDETLGRVSSQMAQALRSLLPSKCTVKSSIL